MRALSRGGATALRPVARMVDEPLERLQPARGKGAKLAVRRRSGGAAAAGGGPSSAQRIISSEATRKGEARDAESGGNDETRLCAGQVSSPAAALGRPAASASASAAVGGSHWRSRVEGRNEMSRRKNAKNTPTSTTTEATSTIAMRLVEATEGRRRIAQLPADRVSPLRLLRPFGAAVTSLRLRPRARLQRGARAAPVSMKALRSL